eukprot:3006682-Rhodomonas_salina.1
MVVFEKQYYCNTVLCLCDTFVLRDALLPIRGYPGYQPLQPVQKACSSKAEDTFGLLLLDRMRALHSSAQGWRHAQVRRALLLGSAAVACAVSSGQGPAPFAQVSFALHLAMQAFFVLALAALRGGVSPAHTLSVMLKTL